MSCPRRNRAPGGGPPATLTYIGPQSSGTPGTVFGELCDALPDGAQAFHSFSVARPLRVISATATGEARGLTPAESCDLGLGRIDGQPRRYASLPPELGVRFLRSIVTDDELMALAVEELRLRNVHPLPRDASCRAGGEDGTGEFVVTISELDTAYGRALPRAFVNALCDAGGCCGSNAAGQRSIPNVLEYGYMRGPDGLVRPAVVGDDQGGRTADLRALAEHASESYIEPAVGSGQFDYLRRLANQLRDKDAELRRDGKGGIRAFGILGNDHSDKLLILQAPREHLPGRQADRRRAVVGHRVEARAAGLRGGARSLLPAPDPGLQAAAGPGRRRAGRARPVPAVRGAPARRSTRRHGSTTAFWRVGSGSSRSSSSSWQP